MADRADVVEELAEAVVLLARAVERLASTACDFDATGDAQVARDVALLALGRPLPA